MHDRRWALRTLMGAAMSACLTAEAAAQATTAAQLAIIQAEERGATAARDLQVL
jgi:hypothetical protein